MFTVEYFSFVAMNDTEMRNAINLSFDTSIRLQSEFHPAKNSGAPRLNFSTFRRA